MTASEDCRSCNKSYSLPYGFTDTGICNPCAQGEAERLLDVEEEAMVLRESLDELRVHVRSVLRKLPQRAWNERLTYALKELERLVAT